MLAKLAADLFLAERLADYDDDDLTDAFNVSVSRYEGAPFPGLSEGYDNVGPGGEPIRFPDGSVLSEVLEPFASLPDYLAAGLGNFPEEEFARFL